MNVAPRIAVVVPAYKVRRHILQVLSRIGPEVQWIYVVDDNCPEGSGEYVQSHCVDNRVVVLRTPENLGVGGAVMLGYQTALTTAADILVKLDGDGQMDPGLIPDFVAPIVAGEADYTKGNRFFNPEAVRSMPRVRLFGNAVLSLVSKFSSGYWHVFDPNNGYTAIHRVVAQQLPFEKISRRYFFESDMLFRLNTLRALVVDIPMEARYGDEESSLKIPKVTVEFLWRHVRNFAKRLFYNYYLRDMSIASFEFPIGLGLFLAGVLIGSYHWIDSIYTGITASAGTVMLPALLTITGLQLLLAFLGHDSRSIPSRPLQKLSRNLNTGDATEASDVE